MAHTTVARVAEATEIRSGSRFLAVVAPVADPGEAAAFLDRSRAAHPHATHHCSAWRVGTEMASSDDGEPGGTAGAPMLGVLLKRDLDFVVAVCVRWYGGTKLGAGGLVRAYSGTVAKALDAAGSRAVHDTAPCRVRAPFARTDAVLRLLDDWPHVEKGEVAYDAAGAVVPVRVRSADLPALERAVADATAGDASVERLEGTEADGSA